MNYIDELQVSLSKRLPAIIISALTLTAGLAWNDAIQSVINYYVPEDRKQAMNIWIKLIYVIILSIVIILLIEYLVRIENGDKPLTNIANASYDMLASYRI